MKHKSSLIWLTGLCLLLGGCQNLPLSETEPNSSSPFPTITVSPTPLPEKPPVSSEPSPTPEIPASPQPMVVYQEQGDYLCTPAYPKNLKLKYPVDLVVNPDGERVFVMNKRCDTPNGSPPYLDQSPYSFEDCQPQLDPKPPTNSVSIVEIVDGKKIPIYSDTQPELDTTIEPVSILEINSGKVSPMRFDTQPELYCTLGEELAIDDNNQLYFNVFNHQQIYKKPLDGEEIEKVVDLKVHQERSWFEEGYSEAPLLSGPRFISVIDGIIYFLLGGVVVNGESKIFKHEKGQSEMIYFLPNGHLGETVFTLYQQNLVVGYTFHKPPFMGENAEDNVFFMEITPKEIKGLKQEQSPTFVINTQGEYYISDPTNHVIWKIVPNANHTQGTLSILAGNGQPGFQDGRGEQARFTHPTGLTLDKHGNLYLADTGNHAIRKITPEGVVTTIYREMAAQE